MVRILISIALHLVPNAVGLLVTNAPTR